MNQIEKLEREKESAWNEYLRLREPADAAYKKYEKFAKLLKELELYEKAKRQVMRDLIKNAGQVEQ